MNSLFFKIYLRKYFKLFIFPFTLFLFLYIVKDIVLNSLFPSYFMKLYYRYMIYGFFWLSPFELTRFENVMGLYIDVYYLFCLLHTCVIVFIAAQEKKLAMEKFLGVFQCRNAYWKSKSTFILMLSLFHAGIFSCLTAFLYHQLELRDWDTCFALITYSILPGFLITAGAGVFFYRSFKNVLYTLVSVTFLLALNSLTDILVLDVTGTCQLINNSFTYSFESGVKISSQMWHLRAILTTLAVLLIFNIPQPGSPKSFYLFSLSFFLPAILYHSEVSGWIHAGTFLQFNRIQFVLMIIVGLVLYMKPFRPWEFMAVFVFAAGLFLLVQDAVVRNGYRYGIADLPDESASRSEYFDIDRLNIRSEHNRIHVRVEFKSIPDRVPDGVFDRIFINPYWHFSRFENCHAEAAGKGLLSLKATNPGSPSALEYWVDFSELASFMGKEFYSLSGSDFIFPYRNSCFVKIREFSFEPHSSEFSSFVGDRVTTGSFCENNLVFLKSISMYGGKYRKVKPPGEPNVFYLKHFTVASRQQEFIRQIIDIQKHIHGDVPEALTGIEAPSFEDMHGRFIAFRSKLFYKKYRPFERTILEHSAALAISGYYRDKVVIPFDEINVLNFFFTAMTRHRNGILYSDKFKGAYRKYFQDKKNDLSYTLQKDDDIFSVPWYFLIRMTSEKEVFDMIRELYARHPYQLVSLDSLDRIILDKFGFEGFFHFFLTREIVFESTRSGDTITLRTNIPYRICIEVIRTGKTAETERIEMERETRLECPGISRIMVDINRLIPVRFEDEITF